MRSESVHRPTSVPLDWTTTQLMNVARIVAGGRLRLTKKDYVPTGKAKAYSAAGQDGWVDQTEFSQPGVVLSAIGARCGKCFFADGDWTTLANTQAILPDPHCVIPRYLYYYVDDETYWHKSGSAQPFIKPRDVRGAWLLLPPRPEQHKIADILGSVDDVIQKTHAVIHQTERVKKGLVQQLLTRGMPGRHIRFKQTEIGRMPADWTFQELGQFLPKDAIRNGIYKPATEYGSGTLIIRIDAFQSGEAVDRTKLKRVRLSKQERVQYAVQPRDILVNRVNSLTHLGKSTLIRELTEPTAFESNMMCLRVPQSELSSPEWIAMLLNQPFAKAQLLSRAKKAIAQASINQKDVRSLLLPFPEPEEQGQILDQIGSLEHALLTHRRTQAQLQRAKAGLLGDLLSGRVRIPL